MLKTNTTHTTYDTHSRKVQEFYWSIEIGTPEGTHAMREK